MYIYNIVSKSDWYSHPCCWVSRLIPHTQYVYYIVQHTNKYIHLLYTRIVQETETHRHIYNTHTYSHNWTHTHINHTRKMNWEIYESAILFLVWHVIQIEWKFQVEWIKWNRFHIFGGQAAAQINLINTDVEYIANRLA